VIDRLRRDPGATLASSARRRSRLYWTAARGARRFIAKNDPELTADLWVTEALMARARELDRASATARSTTSSSPTTAGAGRAGGSIERARESLNEALRWSKGRRAAPLVSSPRRWRSGSRTRGVRETAAAGAAVDVDAAPDQRLGT